METIRFLQGAASPTLDDLALTITNLGHEFAYVALLVIAYLAFDARLGRRLGVYVLIGFYLNGLLKALFDTPRPYQLDPELLRSAAAEATAPGPGFPSGHAQGAMTFWGIAALYARKRWFAALAAVLIVLVSLSRLYLGVHLPADVMGGLVAGGILVALVPFVDRLAVSPRPALLVVLGIGIPLTLHLLASTPDSDLVLGGMAGFLTAPLIFDYRAPRGLGARALVGALGLLLVFAGLFASSALLPEELKRNALGGFLRYQLLAYVGLVVAPAIASLFRGGGSSGALAER